MVNWWWFIVKFELPYPPSLNMLYPSVRSGKRRLSARGKAYKQSVYYIVKQQKIEKLSGSIRIIIHACPPDNRRRDLDNIVKIIFDSLGNAGVFNDDSQIDDFRVIRKPKQKDGAVFVELSEIN
jgi:crossover junction endodeoxyribonuclease RusA